MAIIFWDFDGTLVYSNSLWSTTVFNSLKQVTPTNEITFSEIRKCMAKGFTWHTPNENYKDLIGNQWWEYINNKITLDYISLGIDENTAKKAAQLVHKNIKNIENYTIYADSIQALDKSIQKGHTNVILSNNYPDLDEVLKKLDLINFFDNIIVSANYGYDKPRKEIFDIAKALYPNQDYIMVGDNINADIVGGKNSDMKTVLVHKGYNSNADYCADNLIDIFDLI